MTILVELQSGFSLGMGSRGYAIGVCVSEDGDAGLYLMEQLVCSNVARSIVPYKVAIYLPTVLRASERESPSALHGEGR